MTEGTELAIETMTGGTLFCMALVVIFLLHTAFVKQVSMLGNIPEQLILFEESGE